jgi:hypothetical protein
LRRESAESAAVVAAVAAAARAADAAADDDGDDGVRVEPSPFPNLCVCSLNVLRHKLKGRTPAFAHLHLLSSSAVAVFLA